MKESIVCANIICAFICAKWALELGYSQIRQILLFIAGTLFGPLTLFVLYIYLINKASKEEQPSAKII